MPKSFKRKKKYNVMKYIKEEKKIAPHKDPNLKYIIKILKSEGKNIGVQFLNKSLKNLIGTSKGCVYAGNFFHILRCEIDDSFPDFGIKSLNINALKTTKNLYDQKIKGDIFSAYMCDPLIINKGVLDYMNMVIGIGLGETWKGTKIDEEFLENVEEKLGWSSEGIKEFRYLASNIYYAQVQNNPQHKFMNDLELVNAVTDVKIESEFFGADDFAKTLTEYRTNEEITIQNMREYPGYCKTCARKTIEDFCKLQKS